MVITGCTESMLRELAASCNPANLVAELANRIDAVEQVRHHLSRIAKDDADEARRHRDAIAAIHAERREWQEQCPCPRSAASGCGCAICGRQGGPRQ